MSVLKDAVVVCHSVLVMLALRYLLQEYKLTDCQERYCTSVRNTQVGNDNSHGKGFMTWMKNEEAQEVRIQCLCCKVSHHGRTGFFTILASLHLVISVTVVFLKHKTFSSSKYVWIYIILIIATVINTLFLARLVRIDTHHFPAMDVTKERLLWNVLFMPFRLVWNILSFLLSLLFYDMFMGMLGVDGLFRWYGDSTRGPVMFLCSLDRVRSSSSNLMIQYAVSVLSWTYVASATANIYSLMKSLSKEQREQLQKVNNNNANDKQDKKKECRLCREILAAKQRTMRDVSDSEDSDQDSFVLGWRL